MEGDRELPTWISGRVLLLCWLYEALHCRGAEWPHGWACLVISIWSHGEGWSRFETNTGQSLFPMLQEVYQMGVVMVKEECQHNLSCTWVDFFGVGDPECFHWRLCRFDYDSKCLPWHSAADDQYSGRFWVTLHTVQTSLPAITPFLVL